MSHTVTVTSPAMPVLLGGPALVFYSLDGEEGLSCLYRYMLVLKTPAAPAIAWQSASNLNLKALVGQEMTVRFLQNGAAAPEQNPQARPQDAREISGIVTKARYVERDANQAVYEVQIEPWLHLATLTSDYRIFQNKDVVTIIRAVLEDYDYPVDYRLTGYYPALEYQVQYGETDYAFIQRLMQEWGIYWFFEHDNKQHRLIVLDHVSMHKRTRSSAYHHLAYYPPEHKIDEEYISAFEVSEGLQPGQWVTNDYDFKQSRASLRAIDKQPRSTSHNTLEMYQWPGDYETPQTGEQLARIRMEAAGAPGSRSSGSGNLRGVVCGCTFALHNFPYAKANRDYLVIRAALSLQDNGQTSGQGRYTCRTDFDVQPASKVYRSPQTISKPHTRGPQTAIVVGPAGEEIWTDEYGRVKVAFHWDRYARQQENDSCWIRVSQAWAGSGFGAMYIPRIGQEVIVDFMHGDPDRPLIIGNLYNNVTKPPWELPQHATQSGVISHTLHGKTSNYNGVRFEDSPGREEFRMQAERDMNALTKRDRNEAVGRNMARKIAANELVHIGGNASRLVGASNTTDVGAADTLNVIGTSTVNVGLGRNVLVGGVSTHTVGLGYVMTVFGTYHLTVGESIDISCGLSSISMRVDGTIAVSGKNVTISASDTLNLLGGTVNINPDTPPPPPIPVLPPLPVPAVPPPRPQLPFDPITGFPIDPFNPFPLWLFSVYPFVF